MSLFQRKNISPEGLLKYFDIWYDLVLRDLFWLLPEHAVWVCILCVYSRTLQQYAVTPSVGGCDAICWWLWRHLLVVVTPSAGGCDAICWWLTESCILHVLSRGIEWNITPDMLIIHIEHSACYMHHQHGRCRCLALATRSLWPLPLTCAPFLWARMAECTCKCCAYRTIHNHSQQVLGHWLDIVLLLSVYCPGYAPLQILPTAWMKPIQMISWVQSLVHT